MPHFQPPPVTGAPSSAGQRIDQARRALAGSRIGEPAHEQALDALRALAVGPDGLEAQWLLGAYFLSAEARPGAQAEAWTWLEPAARAGLVPAMDRLAAQHLRGLVRPVDRVAAIDLYHRIAERGFYRAAWELGYLLDQNGACPPSLPGVPGNAATAFARACALGNPQAYLSLGLRFAQGAGVMRDPEFGQALLLRAADARIPGARGAAERMTGTDTAAVQDWHARLKANLDQAQPSLQHLQPEAGPGAPAPHPLLPRLEAHLAGIGHPALRLDGEGRLQVAGGGDRAHLAEREPAWQWLSQSPRVAVAHDFATVEECAHLINKVAGQLAAARSYTGSGSANDEAELSFFTGEGTPIRALHADAVVHTLEQRLQRLTGWRADAMEPCSIIRYLPGQAYRAHVDFFSARQIEDNARLRQDFGGQRLATFLLYLRVPDAGGETDYVQAGLKLRGESGMAVLHHNTTPEGIADPASLHAGAAIERGEKWLWRCTLRERPLVGDAANGHPQQRG
ncbi:MAG: 2OG-Fe(II) oxygenase [Xanthomonadales bacterium]|nr:2OG-Fe(II) oxygenase [Xanthomonadales bacterium]